MQKRRYILFPTLIAMFILMPLTQVSKASIYKLDIFTTNGGYYNHPELDLSVELLEQGSQVRFEFHNDSTIDSSIEGVYFDDGSLLGIVGIDQGPGTAFSPGASPPDLPGGQVLLPPFVTSQGFLADSDQPISSNGLGPGEWMAVVFDLLDGVTIDDVLDELDAQTLRIGVHLINLPDGSSEAAVTPEPATLALFLIGGLALLKRRQRH